VLPAHQPGTRGSPVVLEPITWTHYRWGNEPAVRI
jgi:hypothetical protein